MASNPEPSRPTSEVRALYERYSLNIPSNLVVSVELDLVVIAVPRRLQTP
jgi:hypothetical protein